MKDSCYPLVSVVMASFNNALHIEEAINSILSQTYKNIELIIADDCSQDDTAEIIKKYKSLYPHIIKPVLNKERLGITKNVNTALSQVSGEYITLIGADDIFHECKIALQVEFMKNYPDTSIVYHDVIVFEDETRTILYKMSDRFFAPLEVSSEYVLKHGIFFGTLSCMVRTRDLSPELCDENIPECSDILMIFECLKNGTDKMRYIPQILAFYRRHNKSFTAINKKLLLYKELDLVQYIKIKYPDMIKIATYKESILYFMLFLRCFVEFKFFTALKFLIKHIKTSFKPLTCLTIIFHEIKWRLKTYINRVVLRRKI